MNRTTLPAAFLLVLIGFWIMPNVWASQVATETFNKMPLAFTKNMGQWDERVLFRANAGGATMWFTKEGVTYQFTRRIEMSNVVSALGLDSRPRGNDIETDSIEQLVLTAKFVGANPNLEVIAERQMEYKCNYFFGNDPTDWRTDVPSYKAIVYRDIYPGIDLKYYGDGNGQAAYEFVVAPGVDASLIKVEYEGAEGTSIDADGRMIVRTRWGDMIAAIKSPTDGVLSGTANFRQLSEEMIGFKAEGSNRKALGTLAVGLVYSTYLGGRGNDYGQGIAVDGSGNAYVTGYTYSSNFPTLNPNQTDQNREDAFVAKFSASGMLIYSTYLGGSSLDNSLGIAADGSGNAYLTGYTYSSDFPTLNPYQAYRLSLDADAFVTKLSSFGNSLIYSTYLGGGPRSGMGHRD